MSIGGCQSPTLYGSFRIWRNPPTYTHSQTFNVWCICLHLFLAYPNVGNEAIHWSSGIDFVELMLSWISCCLLGDSFTDSFGFYPSEPPMKIIIPLDCKTRNQFRFQTPNIWVITPKNEGCGFPMVMSMCFIHLHSKNQRKLFNAMLTLDLYPPRVETMFYLKMGQGHPGMARRWTELGNHLNRHFFICPETNSKLAQKEKDPLPIIYFQVFLLLVSGG